MVLTLCVITCPGHTSVNVLGATLVIPIKLVMTQMSVAVLDFAENILNASTILAPTNAYVLMVLKGTQFSAAPVSIIAVEKHAQDFSSVTVFSYF